MASHENIIEVDPSINEGHADPGSYDNSTENLNSSIDRYIYENGRRYHAYWGLDKNLHPTDETEMDRLDMHHEIFMQLLNGELHRAPIGNTPQQILDVGTGTGIWAIDMADKYPNSIITGTDLSPSQPTWVPPNCRFEIDDLELEWTYEPNFFDFIHVRNLSQSISDWPKLLSEVYKCTKPGGLVEIGDLGCSLHSDDDSLPADNDFRRVSDLLNEAMNRIGRPFPCASTLETRLKNAGFVDVVVETYKQPYGLWPRDKRLKYAGAMALMMLETGIEAYSISAYTRILNMEPAEAMKVVRDGLAAVRSEKIHTYSYFYIAYGRKPKQDRTASD